MLPQFLTKKVTKVFITLKKTYSVLKQITIISVLNEILTISPKHRPILDQEFIPAFLWNKAYMENVKSVLVASL